MCHIFQENNVSNKLAAAPPKNAWMGMDGHPWTTKGLQIIPVKYATVNFNIAPTTGWVVFNDHWKNCFEKLA